MNDLQIIPYTPEHLGHLHVLQPGQADFAAVLGDPDYARTLAVPGLTWSGLIGGAVVGCAGIMPVHAGRAVCWALIGQVPRRQWTVLTGEVRWRLRLAHRLGYRRLEAAVRADFAPGLRWAKLLGFVPEGLAEAYWPDRSDAVLYARVER